LFLIRFICTLSKCSWNFNI